MKVAISEQLEEHIKSFKEKKFRGELVKFNELGLKDQSLILAQYFDFMKKYPDVDCDMAYVSLLHSHGVMCPHPADKRIYMNNDWEECRMCKCLVLMFR